MENITKEQADIIGEVAKYLYRYCGYRPQYDHQPFNKHYHSACRSTGQKENTLESDNHILVKVPYTSGLDGTNLMVLDVQDALVITRSYDGR